MLKKYKKHTIKCNPAKKHKTIRSNTCITPNTIEKVKQIEGTDSLDGLYKKYNCPNDDACLLKKSIQPVRTQLLKDFRPIMPSNWKKTPNAWLSNIDILNVLRQEEEAHSDFHVIGPTAIDFDTHLNSGECVSDDLCHFSIQTEIKNGKSAVAIVFNLDKHDEPGSHWTSLFIDLSTSSIFYFDSAKNEVPIEIKRFCQRVAPSFTFYTNQCTHQKSNTECGMYSLYFIIEMLYSTNRKQLFNNRFNHAKKRVSDKHVEQFRRIYFTPI
jgi:hypothetical protein